MRRILGGLCFAMCNFVFHSVDFSRVPASFVAFDSSPLRKLQRLRLTATAPEAATLRETDSTSIPVKLQRLGTAATAREVADVLETDGVVVIERRVSREVVGAAMAELQNERMADGYHRFGPNTQLWKNPLDLVEERVTKSLAEDPLILGAAEAVRQTHAAGAASCINWEIRLLAISPGMDEGPVHRDVTDTSKIPLERPLQWGLNAIWAIDDFTVENGATRFLPGSHSSRWPQGSWPSDHPDAELWLQVASMPAGSVVLYYASVLHGSGESRSDAFRIGLNFNYAYVDSNGQRPAGWGW